MSGKLIATIYFYLISVGSIVLMVIGVFSWANFFINLTQYDKYPTRYGPPVAECDDSGYPYKSGPYTMAIDGSQTMATRSAEEKAKDKEACEKQMELDRKAHKIDDIKNAITFSLVGIILFLIHFPQARKRSV